MSKVVNYNQDSRPSAEFITGCRFFAAGKGSPTQAAMLAEASGRATPRTIEWVKSAVSPGTLGDAQSGGNLAVHVSLVSAFLDSLHPFSTFDTVAAAAKKAPLLTTVASVSLGATGHAADEGQYKRISALQIDVSSQMTPRKASCILVFSNDTWRSGAPGAQEFVKREAQLGVSRVSDEILIEVVSDSAAPIASTGADMGAVHADIAAALSAVAVGRNSRLFLIMHPDNTKALATMPGSAGRAFPDMGPLGGRVCGIETLACDSIASDEVLVLDASSLAVNSGSLVLHAASSATVRMSDDPDSDTALTSLWQKNLLGLRIERSLGCEVIHSAAAALISGATYGAGVTA